MGNIARIVWVAFLLATAAGCTESKPPASKTVELDKIAFELPAGWESQEPSSKMRVAQARVPGEAGDADFAVFYFGEGKGGTAEENINRWANQIEFAPGSATGNEQFDTQGFLIRWVNFEGTLKAGLLMGGPTAPQPSSRLLGAVVEGPGGPWFFKATGPEATLGPQREPFLKMLRSVRGQ